MLAHLADVDARRLYVLAGYPSMYMDCVQELRLSEDAAGKRIQASRAARQFPALFTAVAEGRLHLAAVCLLAPHLTPDDADELVAAATHQGKSEIERLLAQRFPRPELLATVQAIPRTTVPSEHPTCPGASWSPCPASQGGAARAPTSCALVATAGSDVG